MAVKEKKKGKAKGGFIIGKKKGWGDDGSTLINNEEEGVIMMEIKEKGEVTVIISVYNTIGWENIEEKIDRLVEERGEMDK